MHRRMLVIVLGVASAACGPAQPGNQSQPRSTAESNAQHAPPNNPETIKPGEPGGLPNEPMPIAEDVIDPKSAQGAGQVLQRFGGLLEQRKFAEAYQLWSDGGSASGLSQPQFIAAYGKYAEIHSEVGAPGHMEGAAGSSYVEIPFRLYGRLNNGTPFNLVGPVTLRRVNDVPGSSEGQRRWHIYKSDLAVRP